jgi:4-hydroxymandelate oxidase
MPAPELLTLDDYETAARAVLDPATVAYVAGGAGSERSVAANRAALDRLWLRPRVLTPPAAEPDCSVTIMGSALSLPVLLAPTSPVRLLHPDAESGVARAAAAAGTIAMISTDSHEPYPAVAAAARGATWFQLYAYRSLDDVARTVGMAEEAGAGALVVTVDGTWAAQRVSARRAGFALPGEVDFGTLAQLGIHAGHPPPSARLDRLPLTWDDLAWLRGRTALPLVVKGVLHPADARACADAGVDGVVVSNHGGRQLDGVVPGIVALPAVVDAVGTDTTVLFDGGIRSGIDVVRALALGARAVCLGRPYLWGLALAGERGVGSVLNLVADELRDALRQLGLASVGAITGDCLFPVDP